MKAAWLIGGAALALTSTLVLAQDRPADLLPPGFDEPTPSPTPSPRASEAPAPTQTSAPSQPSAPQPAPTRSGEVVQPLPSDSAPAPSLDGFDLEKLPTLNELESMSTDELDDFLGLKPRYDIPPAARRSLERVGVIAPSEGGLPTGSLAKQPAALVRAVLAATKGPPVSRWGHILLRRALASRLTAPEGMDPVEFATLRLRALNAMGEFAAARAVAQDIDTGNYTAALADAAVTAYVGTSDIVGACPAVRLVQTDRDDPEWKMLAAICNAYAGEETRGLNDLRRLQNRGEGERIDVLLSQRYAGAAGNARRAVTIEWDGVEDVTPWRFALASSLGETLPEDLSRSLGDAMLISTALNPAIDPLDRARGADIAAATGVFSSRAMVDLYSLIFAEQGAEGDAASAALRLREAYVGSDPAARLAAIRDVWDGNQGSYGRMVLTAYAAARMPVDKAFAGDAGRLIAAMLTAGLDRDAMRWNTVVDTETDGWAQLALANPAGNVRVTDGQLSSFSDADDSQGRRKSKMLLAGLAGLGRVSESDLSEYTRRLEVDFSSPTRWTRMIDRAAAVDNRALVAMLAGLGMQGSSWDRMTARHLYHIVAALRQVGLEAEARMIAAEAVARV